MYGDRELTTSREDANGPLGGDAAQAGPFRPTAGMRRYAQACCNYEIAAKPDERCKAALVSVRSLARWQRRRAFRRWLNKEVIRLMRSRTYDVWTQVLSAALKGNMTASKLFVERFDRRQKEESAFLTTFKEVAELAEREEEAMRRLDVSVSPGPETQVVTAQGDTESRPAEVVQETSDSARATPRNERAMLHLV